MSNRSAVGACLLTSMIGIGTACATAQAATELRAGIPGHFPPQYVLDRSGRPGGFAVEVFDAVAERAGYTVRYTVFETWPEAMAALRNQQIDVIPNMGIATERESMVRFTAPVETFPVTLFVRSATHDIRGSQDLAGRRVSVVAENIGEQLIANYPEAVAVVHKSRFEPLLALLSGDTDAVIYPRDAFLYLARDAGLADRITALEPPLLEVKRAIGVRRDDAVLHARLDNALRGYLASADYQAVYSNWHGESQPYWTVRRLAAVLLGALLVLIATLAVWRYREVRRLQSAMQAREEQRQRAEDFQAIVDSSPDAMVIVDDKGLIERVNQEAQRLFAYAPEELLGNSVELLVPERFRAGHAAHRYQFNLTPRRRPMGQQIELFGRRKSGEEFSIDVNLSPVRLHERAYVLAAIRDTTAYVEAERSLREARDEAERVAAAKSRFLAAASHDLRQPLQSQSLYLSVLEERLEEPECKRIAGLIGQSLDAMGGLLDALLDISKLDTGSIEPVVGEVPLQEVLDQLIVDNMPYAEHKGLALRVVPTSYVTRSDTGLLLRIVENLVVNAIRYTEAGRILVGCRRRGEQVCIEVWDTGIGMPAESLGSIFHEYVQLDNPARDRSKGLGLGLSIVQRLVTLLDHGLDVRSTPGKGSVFSVSVPFAGRVQRRLAEPAAQEAVRDRTRTTVLFVDDDPAILSAMELLMETCGFDVITGATGEEAMDRLQSTVPSVVVSDFRLPEGETGIEVVQLIRQRLRTDLPAIILTGDTTTQSIDSANLAACHVLRKPVDSDKLIALIESVTGGTSLN